MSPKKRLLQKRRYRATRAETEAKVQRARQDPDILRLGVVEAMHRFNLNYVTIMQIRRELTEDKLRSGQAEELIEIQHDRDHTRLRNRIIRAEQRHPLIHRRIVADGVMNAVAQAYGLTRERVRQIRNEFNQYVEDSDILANDALDEIEEAAS